MNIFALNIALAIAWAALTGNITDPAAIGSANDEERS